MRIIAIFVSLLLTAAAAQASNGAPGAPTKDAPPQKPLPALVSHPPLKTVQRAMNGTNLSRLEFTVEVQWNADGTVTGARVLERTPSASVERAALDWVRALRFEAGASGMGRIPFKLRNDRLGGGNAPWPMTPFP